MLILFYYILSLKLVSFIILIKIFDCETMHSPIMPGKMIFYST